MPPCYNAFAAGQTGVCEHMDAVGAVLEARRLLSGETPLKADCGALCGAACCRPDEEGKGGMLLFPGEEVLYSTLPPGFSIVGDDLAVPDGKLLVCQGVCSRGDRPLACRFFPLFPSVRQTRKGAVLRMELDRRAWPVCPLMPHGLPGLSGAFMLAARQAALVLAGVSAHRAFMLRLTQFVHRHYHL
ncbi:MAG: hypothetical protein ACOX63_03810 [Christensenellales bacterium]|jgi:hypothetical protein